jgi:transketolase
MTTSRASGSADATRPEVERSPTALPEEAALLRRDIVEALYQTGGGHYGGSLSVIDLLLTLYRRQLRIAPAAPRHPGRDRLILSKGHAAIALYAVLRRLGYFAAPLGGYASFDSPLEGHPDMTRLPGVDFSTGSLGQGLSVGVGAALAVRSTGARVWVVLGDGECQEGQIWEAAMLAAHARLGNLHVVVDHNRFQEWGWNRPEPAAGAAGTAGSDVPPAPIDRLVEKWQAFGWHVLEVDGHEFDALERAFRDAVDRGVRGAGPSVVVAHTMKGKGVPLIEADPMRFHCGAVTAAEHEEIVRSLRWR